MKPEVRSAIVQAANENGIDPAYALAVAERESSGNPNAKSSKSIYGLFQMRGALREKYGAGDSADPLTQARAWAAFTKDLKKEMLPHLGREPTDRELYLGHHFGGARAARMIAGKIDPGADVADVFSPNELAINPHIGKAGTVGRLTSTIQADIGRRQAKHGGAQPAGMSVFPPSNEAAKSNKPDFSQYGQPVAGAPASVTAAPSPAAEKRPPPEPVDFSEFGQAVDPAPPLPPMLAAPAATGPAGPAPAAFAPTGAPAAVDATKRAPSAPDQVPDATKQAADATPLPFDARPVAHMENVAPRLGFRPGTEIDLAELGVA